MAGEIPINGLDFTSAPRQLKPITLARGSITGNRLSIETIESLTTLEAFEDFIASLEPSFPSVTALDLPFGQPRRLIENLEWEPDWSLVVRRFAAMTRPEFLEFLRLYRNGRPPGDKQPLREIDRVAGACSPMMVYGTPVGRMYHAATPILERSPLNLAPCRPTSSQAIVIEAYPALIARRFAQGKPYKTDDRKLTSDPVRRQARQGILEGLLGDHEFGLDLHLSLDSQGIIEDASGDRLDALACAVTAAWAWLNRESHWGIPPHADPLEGWIPDPSLLPPPE